jgi:hypothetical protein
MFYGSDDHASAAGNVLSLVASCKLHDLDPELYFCETIKVLPYWPRDRYLELAPKYWRATRARLDPRELERELGPITVRLSSRSHLPPLRTWLSVRTSDGLQGKTTTALEETSRELLRVHADLAAARLENPRDWFFNCWFLSVGHLMVMLDNVASADEFKRELFMTRSVTTGSLDFYFEYSQGRALRGQADRWGAPCTDPYCARRFVPRSARGVIAVAPAEA